MRFTCQITSEGLRLNVGPHEGSYPAWWQEIRAEIYGWKPDQGAVFINSSPAPAPLTREPERVIFVFSDDGKGVQAVAK